MEQRGHLLEHLAAKVAGPQVVANLVQHPLQERERRLAVAAVVVVVDPAKVAGAAVRALGPLAAVPAAVARAVPLAGPVRAAVPVAATVAVVAGEQLAGLQVQRLQLAPLQAVCQQLHWHS